MKCIRPIEKKDHPALEDMAMQAGMGITSLPKNTTLLEKKVEESIKAFRKSATSPHHYHYLFVLEDLETGNIEGTCAIQAKTGVPDPIIYYKMEKIPAPVENSHIPEFQTVLTPVYYHDGPTEICGIFLRKEARKEGFGRLLSYSRFLFMATHPHRFSPYIVAAMRGYMDEKDESPVWNKIGRHFYDVGLTDAFQMCIQKRNQMIQILPQHPIYVSLLPKTIQKLLGKTHPHTRPALKLLFAEGFHFTKEIDIIDGGPKIGAELHSISTFKNSESSTVSAIKNHVPGGQRSLVSNESLNFRATLYPIVKDDTGEVIIESKLADALQVKEGDRIRWTPIEEKKR